MAATTSAARERAERHPNAEVLLRSVHAAAAGAMERLRELCADDLVVHRGPDALGCEEGLTEFVALARRGAEFHDVLANDEHGVVLQQLYASHRPLVCHFRGGRIAEIWLL